jgi:hypothetical protein
MPNLKLIPVDFIVELATAQKSAHAAKPYRQLIEEWFRKNHSEAEGYEALRAIDDSFPSAAKQVNIGEEMLVVLPGCVLGRFRTDVRSANMLVMIVREIHRRMTIPEAESRKAKRPEDIRQTLWTWPHVMRVMKRKGIIADDTKKAVFGEMIERILGDKVKPNSIRRANYGNYSIVDKYDFDLKDADKDIIKEITALFIPLFMPKN